jgi:diguanylate cyclase (GGDEF)-like protein
MNNATPITMPQSSNLCLPTQTACITFNSKHEILHANAQAHQLFGDILPGTILSDTWLSNLGINLSDRSFRTIQLEDLLNNQIHSNYIGFSLTKETRWAQWHLDKNKTNTLFLTDVTDLVQEIHAFQQKAEDADNQDFATKLYNRRYAMERLEQMHHHAKRYQSPFTIAMIDIDHFKRINDTFGHNYGDQVLERLAQVIRRGFRETDLCARFGGEEFLVLMPETDTQDAIMSLDRLRQQVSELKWEQMQRPVTISSGVISWQQNKSVEQLIFLADQRVMTAKKAGRNQVCGDLI